MNDYERHVYEDAKLAYAALMKVYPLTLEDLPSEVWLPVPAYEGYLVSNFGRVKSFKQSKQLILKPCITRNGYVRVNLCKGNKKKHFLVHRLVALAFIPNPDSKPQINHRDGHKLNNFVGNLEWCTRSENMRHAVAIGLKVGIQGEEQVQAKLTNQQARFVRENPDGLTQHKLAELFGVDRATIIGIQFGKTYKKAGGTVRQGKKQKYTPRIPDDIRKQIKAEYVRGSHKFGSQALAKKFGVNKTTILNIVRHF